MQVKVQSSVYFIRYESHRMIHEYSLLYQTDLKKKRKSDAENEFISKLGVSWLGITDEKEEGHFVDIKGSDLSWSNWGSNQGSVNNKRKNEGWFASSQK